MPNDNKTWWSGWIKILTGIGALCALILGGFSWQYSTFATHEKVAMADQAVKVIVVELAKETIQSFKSINATNQQMQQSIERNDLRYTYDRLMDEKYRILKLLKEHPNDEELQKDLEKSKSRIENVEKQIQSIK